MVVIYVFDDYELDPARFELRRQGSAVAVQPKVMRLLLLLVEQRQRALSERELMAALWPAEHVGPASLKRAVMGARAVIGDREQARIRTLRKHGYQFVGPVLERPRSASSPPPGPPPDEPSPRAHGLVGRAEVLLEVDAQLTRSLAGDARLLLLLGEAGIGKTELLRQVAREAAARGALVWTGRCTEFEGAPPFWPFRQVLERAARDLAAPELGQLLGTAAADVDTVGALPADGLALGGTAFAVRPRLFRDVAQALMRASATRPLVVLLDDLHQADEPSLLLLRSVLQQLGATPVLVVGTARLMGPHLGGSSARVRELSAASTTTTIELRGLSAPEIAEFVAVRTGTRPGDALAAQLHDRTSGNPLFVEELVRGALLVSPELGDAAGFAPEEGAGAGRGLHGAIERHLRCVSASSRAVLARASVLGREFPTALLRKLWEGPADELFAALDEAMAAGIITPVRGSIGVHRFRHALIRDVLYGTLGALERCRHHGGVARAMEATSAGSLSDVALARVAEHYRLAAPSHDGGKALAYAEALGLRALQRHAYEDAARQLAHALSLLDLGSGDPAARLRLLVPYGEALSAAGDARGAREPLVQALGLARAHADAQALVRIARVLGRVRESGDVDPLQIATLREAIAALPSDDPHAPCLRGMLAKSLSFVGEYGERAELAAAALSLARELTDPSLRGEALFASYEALCAPEHLPERKRIASELHALSLDQGAPHTLVYALSARFQNAVELGDAATLRVVVESLRALSKQLGDPAVRWYEASYRATLAWIDGDLVELERSAREALEISKIGGGEGAQHWFGAQLLGALRLQGRIAEASSMVAELCTRFPTLASWRAVAASLHCDLGMVEVARSALQQLMGGGVARLYRDPYQLAALCAVADLAARVDDRAAAAELHAALAPFAERHGNVSFGASSYGPVQLYLARLSLCMGEHERALDYAQGALAAARKMPSPLFELFAKLSTAVIHHKRAAPGDAQRARTLFDECHSFASTRGMHGLLYLLQRYRAA